MYLRSLVALPALMALLSFGIAAQVVPNRGLTAPDLESARTLVAEVGGPTATFVYANRFDPVTTGTFDSLLVIYSLVERETPVYFAFIQRLEQRLSLTVDPQGRLLPRGDSFLRIGLRRLKDAPSILRIVGSSPSSNDSTALRNVDYQFNGTQFLVIGQSTSFQSR